ncbi:DUF397 domain-containing protein [Nocardia nova]|uniref:DUF397 domain-containing protein n=1 Tax=Nocardia nova TaxID=37330 RepID=UPI000CE9B102|nr:DUF397 domain-containing protein [Nocardia nova]PPI99121.1 DUF397 domain-containing protein [Nocardia nova]
MSTKPSNPQWFKSSYSSGSQECVEVAFLGADSVGVRDSKCPGGAVLTFTVREWDTFTTAIAGGRF